MFFIKNLHFNKNTLKYFIFGIALILVIYHTWQALGGVDFDVFLHAGEKIRNHQNVYQPPFIRNLQYFYSPLFALILSSFSSLPYWIPECIWLIFSCYWIYRSWILCTRYFNTSILSSKNYSIWFWLCVLFSLRFILDNFTQVQMSIFLLWATLESLHLLKKRKIFIGAALLALAINIKILPILFIPYLFYRKKIKEGFLVILFLIVYLYLPILFIGYEYNHFLLNEWWKIINPTNPEHIIEATNGPHSLDAMLSVFITNTNNEMEFKRNILNLSFKEVNLIINITRLFFILLTLYFLKSLPFKTVSNTLKEFWEMSYLFLITPLIFPHMQIYNFIYVCPMIMYLLYFFIVQKQRNINVSFSIIYFGIISIMFTPIIGRDVIGAYLFHLLQYYRILTFTAILLIPIALMANPRKISKETA